ncbi:hypothetical protein D9600_12360 [Deinococcus sp. DB0503]|nr:hypothetical protein [Deinococcus sp. DB0503]
MAHGFNDFDGSALTDLRQQVQDTRRHITGEDLRLSHGERARVRFPGSAAPRRFSPLTMARERNWASCCTDFGLLPTLNRACAR